MSENLKEVKSVRYVYFKCVVMATDASNMKLKPHFVVTWPWHIIGV